MIVVIAIYINILPIIWLNFWANWTENFSMDTLIRYHCILKKKYLRSKNLTMLIEMVMKYLNFNCDRNLLIFFFFLSLDVNRKILICRWILMRENLVRWSTSFHVLWCCNNYYDDDIKFTHPMQFKSLQFSTNCQLHVNVKDVSSCKI